MCTKNSVFYVVVIHFSSINRSFNQISHFNQWRINQSINQPTDNQPTKTTTDKVLRGVMQLRTLTVKKPHFEAIMMTSWTAFYTTMLDIPRTTTSLKDGAFAVAGPRVWNSLPPAVRHCRRQSSESCWKLLICLFKGRGASDLWTGALEM